MAIAVVAGVTEGIVPGLVAAGAGWFLNVAFMDDWSLAALLAFPAWLAAGGAAGWLGTRLRERARAERVAENRLSALGDAASDAIFRVDVEGAITDWSAGAKALYGYSSAEIVGRPFAELFVDPAAARTDETSGEETVDQKTRDGRVFSASVAVVPGPDDAVIVARDVGERRRIADQLRNTEGRYRSLTEHLPVVTYVRSLAEDGDGETIFMSPQIDRLVGYTAEEWLDDPGLFLRLVHPKDRERVAAERAAVDAAKGMRSSYRLVARDGRVVWVREEAVVVLDESGEPLCVQGYLLDVSERHAAELERNELRSAAAATAEKARDRQRKAELVAEAASVLASSLDATVTVPRVAALAVRDVADWCTVDRLEEDGSLTRIAAEQAQPATPSEPPPRPETDVLQFIRERRPEITESQLRLPLASRDGRAVGALTFVTDERRRRYVAEDLSWASALAGMIALAIDNSRLQTEVEARSDATRVLTHVGDSVFLVDRGGLIRTWNPAAAAITGVSAEAAIGTPAAEAVPAWREVADRVPVGTTRDPARPSTLPLDTERGERWISISGVEFFGGTVYAFRDITEEHKLEELKAEFITTASHELRTPLAAVYGAAQTLRRHDFALDEAGRARFVSLIVDESERLASIVNQILLANQLEVGRVDLVTEPFDATNLLERVIESARTHAPEDVTFEITTADGVPQVAADKDRARQILVNLVDNAVKYSPGGGRVELGVEARDGTVRFRVVDEGLGIPADEQARVFEKFYRLDPDMTQGIGGTGLGLYICRELVERMGGRIWLESQEGKGSTFYFELPSASQRPLSRSATPVAG